MTTPDADASRRAVLLSALATAGWWALPAQAQAQTAYNAAAFDAQTLPEALNAAGLSLLDEGSGVTLDAPEAVDNGALVPMALGTTLPGARRLALLAPHNPTPLLAVFELTPYTAMPLSLRVKLAESGDVYAVVQMDDGRSQYAKRMVRVSVSGCD